MITLHRNPYLLPTPMPPALGLSCISASQLQLTTAHAAVMCLQLEALLGTLPPSVVSLCPPAVLQSVSDTVTPQGVVAIIRKPGVSEADLDLSRDPMLLLVLDQVGV
jgi:tRNA G18 (ribose-2'-O)-methylase SpoU